MKLHLELWMFEKYDRVFIPKETTEITFGDFGDIDTKDIHRWWDNHHRLKTNVFFWFSRSNAEITGYTKAGYNTNYHHKTTFEFSKRKTMRKAIRCMKPL